MSTALVTGASGLVGSHIVDQLLAEGWEVQALSRNPIAGPSLRSGRHAGSLRSPTVYQGDVLDAESVARAAIGCDVIFHCAAAITVRGGWEEYRRVNVDGTRSVIDAASRAGARLVQVSSVAVYGSAGRFSPDGRKTHEDTPLPPLHPRAHYARSKRESEAMVLDAHRAGRIWATAVRPDVIYGPRDRQFVPRMGRMVSTGFAPAIGRGNTTLAVVHAANVADGAIRAGMSERAGGRPYNLANDFDVTVERFFQLAAQGLGKTVRIVHVPFAVARAGMRAIAAVDALVLGGKFSVATSGSLHFLGRDNPFTSERARVELGWSPPVRPEDGIPDAFRWWNTSRGGVA